MAASQVMAISFSTAFDVPQEYEAVLQVARKVAARLAPDYVQNDLRGEFRADVLATLGEAGLLGLNTPEDAGGEGAGELLTGMVCEELASADFLSGVLVIQSGTACKLLHHFGDPEVAAEWLPRILAGRTTIALALTEPQSGSDLAEITTRARMDGSDWVISGEKSCVSLSGSEGIIVLARTPDGPSLFLVPAGSGGHTISKVDYLGGRASGRGIMIFDDVRVPARLRIGEPNAGIRLILRSLSSSRLLACLVAIGAASAAVDDAVTWAKERRTFGAPLATRQGVAFPLVDAWTDIELARLMCHKGLWKADRGLDFRREAAMAKSWIPSRMVAACHEALLIFGHVGYSREHPGQVRLRDVIGTEIGEGSANVQRILLARELLGVTPG
jgi:cyclohexanecarboxyl-CoA dehydrogenase